MTSEDSHPHYVEYTIVHSERRRCVVYARNPDEAREEIERHGILTQTSVLSVDEKIEVHTSHRLVDIDHGA